MTTPNHDLKVEIVEISTLIPDPANARKHGQRNLDAIRASLREFGQRRALVVTGESVVIAGNGTMEAAKALGWTKIAITRTPKEWDYDRARAYALADNRTAELAEWDMKILNEQLLELDANGFNITDLGFDPLLPPGEVVQDLVPEPPVEPKSKSNQLWALGKSRLLVGDSTDKGDMTRLMGGDLADCVWTDPPYNVAYQGGTKDALTIENDDMSDSDFEAFLLAAYSAMYEATMPGGAIYVAHADSAGHTFRKTFVESGYLLKQCLIWVKDTFVLGRQDYHWQHEPILYGWKPGAAHNWYGPRTRATVLQEKTDLTTLKKDEMLAILQEIQDNSSVIREDKPRRNAEHPTMKPVVLVARMLANSTKRGDIVLDPFGGSGSTLIAAAQMDRRCYTIEKDPRYADVIIQRWEALTGQKAELVEVDA